MISVTILVKDSERYIRRVLESLCSFDEVVVVDTGSSDHTIEIASSFPNVSLYERPFQGFGPTHNLASSLARYDWILSIDSDEIMTRELVDEIHALDLDSDYIYSFWRKNFYRGRHIRGCGWYPDRVDRLYNRKRTAFSEALVHESIVQKGVTSVPLTSFVLHYPYDSIRAFLQKMDTYTGLYAEQNISRKSSLCKAVGHALFAFMRSYIFQRGFLLGSEGLEISWFNMNCAFYKYAKLAEKRRKRGS